VIHEKEQTLTNISRLRPASLARYSDGKFYPVCIDGIESDKAWVHFLGYQDEMVVKISDIDRVTPERCNCAQMELKVINKC